MKEKLAQGTMRGKLSEYINDKTQPSLNKVGARNLIRLDSVKEDKNPFERRKSMSPPPSNKNIMQGNKKFFARQTTVCKEEFSDSHSSADDFGSSSKGESTAISVSQTHRSSSPSSMAKALAFASENKVFFSSLDHYCQKHLTEKG